MPEYLAPGVYVEETSFRSKSIEGVSTTTTAFIGPTLKGPYGDVPELLTSFGDFERIYGGLDNINGQTNYLAHAVKAFFDNGGSRLYVSRVVPVDETTGDLAPPEGSFAQSADLVEPGAPEVRFVARFPGEGGNGEVEIFEKALPASTATVNSAPVGSIVRLNSSRAGVAQPAQAQGSIPAPFSLTDGAQLTVNTGSGDQSITFRGKPAEAVSSDALGETLDLSAEANQVFTVQIGSTGPSQTVTLPAGDAVNRAKVLSAINQQLRGGYARLTPAPAAPNDHPAENSLVIGTDVRGISAQIQVSPNPALQFPGPEPVVVTADPSPTVNNVADVWAVTIAEIQLLIQAADIGITATKNSNSQLIIRTTAVGSSATLSIGDTPAARALGLTSGEAQPGQDGSTVSYYQKAANTGNFRDWVDEGSIPLTETAVEAAAQVDLITLSVIARDSSGTEVLYEGLGLDPTHPMWIGTVLTETPTNRNDAINNPFALRIVGTTPDAFQMRTSLMAQPCIPVTLASGADLGNTASVRAYQTALNQLESLEDISIVAAPGYSAISETVIASGIQNALLTYVSPSRRRAYKIAVLDAPRSASLNDVRNVRSRIDSSYAALYYPWVIVANPLFRPGDARQPAEIALPPSGFICGIYARNDVQRGVHKAPANEVVLGALRFERDINFAQQEVLNPLGINCLRFFPGRGYRVWGARTASSDPEWKYINVRRYFIYLEASIDRSTQWAVFEPNGERLWDNIRRTVESFLENEWREGRLAGAKVEQAFFVRCDRSTMTQNDIDNGRMICLIGVAPLYPAEFVIFRIGQWTANARR
jgi:phage tail sheath protein FI